MLLVWRGGAPRELRMPGLNDRSIGPDRPERRGAAGFAEAGAPFHENGIGRGNACVRGVWRGGARGAGGKGGGGWGMIIACVGGGASSWLRCTVAGAAGATCRAGPVGEGGGISAGA